MDVRTDDDSLRERVLRRIRLDVVSGEVEPGTLYSVPALARSLGISTTPIREALLELTTAGLLEPLRNRGFRVVDPSLDELRDLFEVRVQLEVQAFVKLAGSGPADVGDLARKADEIAAAVENGDVPAYLEADRAFHLELLSRAGNRVLTDTVMGLRDRMRLYGIRSPAGLARQRASVAEHHRILAILRRSEIDSAREVMTEHIMDWQPVFTAAIEARRSRFKC